MADDPTGERRVSAVTSAVAALEPDSSTVSDTPPVAPSRSTLRPRITRASSMADLHEGSPVGDYEISGLLGEGGMGTVYSAVHPLIGKHVAIKVLKPELCANQASLDRFVTEARAVNQIGHPNIVDVFGFGELPDGRAFFVMEWLRGEDLKQRLSRGPMAVAETCDILDSIARALDAAHAKDIVHRDLKPDNVFLHQVDNGPLMAKLLDFGIAKLLRTGATAKEKTQTGNMLGTPRYISPEQARGVDVDHRADIYSLGVMAYEMLAGRCPFNGETAMDLVVKHLSEPAPELSLFAKVPEALERCVMRMLEKDPARRPTLAEVRGVLVDPSRRFTPVPSRRIAHVEAPRARRWPYAVAGASALGLGVVLWQVLGGPKAPPPPPPAVIAPAPVPAPITTPTPVPPPAEPAQAALQIDVDGPNASAAAIFVDGLRWGLTSQSKIVSPGTHHVEIRAPGIEPLARDVDVKPNANKTIQFAMPARVPPPSHTPRPKVPPVVAPPVVTPPPVNDDALLRPKQHP